MKLQVLGAGLLLLGLSAAGVWAEGEGASVPTNTHVLPTSFHWTHRTGKTVFHFDARHGTWDAEAGNGLMSVTDSGRLKEHEGFYGGLANAGCWVLESLGAPESRTYDAVQWNYVVETSRHEHHVSFNDTNQAPYQALVTYVNGTLVGQEEQKLVGRLK